MKKVRTRNNNTITEAAFWGVIRSALRERFDHFPKIKDSPSGWQAAKIAVERQTRKVGKYLHVECEGCHKLFRKNPKGERRQWQKHHVIECGNLPDDPKAFIERLFCEDPGLYQVLCKKCHDKKKK